MNVSRDEAEHALADIAAAGDRSARLQAYRRIAPYLILWGGIWLVANLVTDLCPVWSNAAWLTLDVLGAVLSVWFGIRRRRLEAGTTDRLDQGWRWGLCFAVIFAFFVATLLILQPVNARQLVAYISIVWTFLYTALGVWLGMRLFAIGAVASLLIVIGYLAVDAHFFLYMGLVAGGALMAGGLWLRRV